MKIIILEPYLTGSHAAWAQEYAARSRHDVEVMGLPGRHWKWRMHGGAVTLARMFRDRSPRCDLIIATDMLDLATFLALAGEQTRSARTAVYFHENQIAYPWSDKDPDPAKERDVHYAFINFTSALAADLVVFNSDYNRRSFLMGLGSFLREFPDHNETESIQAVSAKSRVLHLGLDLARFDSYRQEPAPGQPALILWNHRWEYDKNPEDFFQVLFTLMDEQLGFRVAILGERFAEKPQVFDEAARRLGGRILQFGFVEDFASYASWLWRADIVPVTSSHDFFGVSVVQAMYCNCYPLLPRRLAYPEHIPPDRHDAHLYDSVRDLTDMVRHRIEKIAETRKVETQHFVSHYDWRVMAPEYDRFFGS